MNDVARKQSIQKAVKPKFRSNQKLKSKVHINYPEGIEREFQRVTDAYMRLANQVVKTHLPEIRAAATKEREANRRTDSMDDLMRAIEKSFQTMHSELELKTEEFGLRRKLENLANLTRKLSIREWKRVVERTLGIDIMEDYYLGEFYRNTVETWIDNNVGLIKTIPQDSLSQMKTIVSSGFRSGRTTTAIVKEIQHTYGVQKRSARLIARDQLGKLNGQLAKQQQEDAGVEEYIWSSSKDSRVRTRHRELDGHKFKWSDPPVVDKKTGRRAHPGEDYECRCVALPVFNIATVDFPTSGPMKEGE